MSISTEITRLQNAKAAIVTAVENKGVTVPSGTKLDGMSTLIGQIQSYGPAQEVTTEAAMTALLVAENVGKAYRYTGTTGTYTYGDVYMVVAE